MSDLAKEIAQTVVRIKSEMRKASFASRSEAGRYAANQRWKGQGKKGKTADDDGLSIRGMTPEKRALDELRVYAEEQRGLLDAMRGVASKAEIKQQIGLVNLADRDLRRMEQAQAKAEPPKSTHRAEYLKYRIGNKEGRDRAFSEANIMKAGKGLKEKYGAPLATKDDVAFAAKIKDELETAISPLEQEVRDVLGKLDANEGDRATNLKSLQRVKTKFAALARKSEKDAKASGNYANALEENTVRTMVSRTRTQIFDMASKDVGFVLDQEKAIDKGLQSRMSKGKSFASRSEAGRYAANMRWQGQGQASMASNEGSAKHKVDFKVNESGRFTHVEGSAFDGQVKYMIGNENEFPDDMDFGFAFSMPGEGFIHAAILKSGFNKKVMSNTNDTPSLDQIKNRTVELNQELGQAVSDHLKTLNIREIAKGIEQEYTRADKTIPRAVSNAITSMKSMRNIDDVQGYATGQKVVSRAVSDLASFNTEIGKMVKAELRGRVKNASPKAPTAGLRRANSLPFDELRSN
jgi:hypothetical protein